MYNHNKKMITKNSIRKLYPEESKMNRQIFTNKTKFKSRLKELGIKNNGVMSEKYKRLFRENYRRGVILPTLNVVYRPETDRFVKLESEFQKTKLKKNQFVMKESVKRERRLKAPKAPRNLQSQINRQQAYIEVFARRYDADSNETYRLIIHPVTAFINRQTFANEIILDNRSEDERFSLNRINEILYGDNSTSAIKRDIYNLWSKIDRIRISNFQNISISAPFGNTAQMNAFGTFKIKVKRKSLNDVLKYPKTIKSETVKVGENNRNLVSYKNTNELRYIFRDGENFDKHEDDRFYIENGCWLNSIMSLLITAHRNYNWGQRTPRLPTVDFMFQLMGLEFSKEELMRIQNEGLSFNDIIPILEHFKMGAVELDGKTMKILNKHPYYKCTGYKNTLPRTIYFVKTFHKGIPHIEMADKDLFQTISMTIKEGDYEKIYRKQKLSDKTRIPTLCEDKEEKEVVNLILGVDADLEKLLYSDEYFGKKVNIISNQPLEAVAECLLTTHGIRPVSRLGKYGMVQSLSLSCFNDRILNFSNQFKGQIEFKSIDEYRQFCKAKSKFATKVRCRKYQSTYNKNVRETLNNIRGGVIGSFVKEQCDVYQVDFNKMYPSVLADLPFIPTITVFDEFVDYDSEEGIVDHHLYLISINHDWNSLIYNERSQALCFGIHLKHYDHFSVISVLKCKTVKNFIKKDMEELWTNETLTSTQKKFILNCNIGINGKKRNSSYQGELFDCERSAHTHCEELKKLDIEASVIKVTNTNFYAVQAICEGKELIDGFLLLHLIVLEGARHKLQQLAYSLEDYCEIMSFKVDCLNIKKSSIHREELEYLLDGKISHEKDFDSFGKVKIEEKENSIPKEIFRVQRDIPLPKEMKRTNLIQIPDESNYQDENWTKEVTDIIKSKKFLRVEASVPGAGKSTILKKAFPNALFVCPTNALKEEIQKDGFHACTFATFFGIAVIDNTRDKKMGHNPSFNLTNFNEIVFDEVYLLQMSERVRIFNWIHYGDCDKKLYATGDISQLSNFLDEQYSEEDINKSVEILFPNKIFFKKSKRGSNKEECDKINKFCENFPHDDDEKARAYVKEHFKTISDKKEIKRLFKNKTQGIGDHTFNRRIKELLGVETFRVGEQCVVKTGKRYKEGKNIVFSTNTSALCKSVSDDVVVLTHGESNEDVPIKREVAEKFFTIHESRTCQSLQGLSRESICLMGYGYQSARWIYTAITRARNFGKVFLIDTRQLPEDPEKDDWKSVERNIKGNLREDERKNRRVDDPVTLSWVKNKYNKCQRCAICKQTIDSIKDLSIDRIASNQVYGHDKDNCQLTHLNCNIQKGRV